MNEEALNRYLPVIQNHYSTIIKKDDVEVLRGGYAHTVLKIQDQVFRFPKKKESELNHHAESIFSKQFSKIVSVHIPVIHNHSVASSEFSYQTYQFISGVPFTKEYASTLKEQELLTIAESIGKFLTQLHAVPSKEVNLVNQVNTSEEYARYFLDIIDEDKKLINSLLTPHEWEWIEKSTEAYYALCHDHPFQLKVTHSDLFPKHILIDEKIHRLHGIIDFSLKIADPAIDFRYFDRYGELFIKTVYDNYFTVDDYFDARRKFYARDFLVGHLYLTTKAKVWNKQREYLKELQEYIANHPL